MLTRFIYPLSLREKLSYRLQKLFPNTNDQNIPLEFDKHVKLDLSKNDGCHQSIMFNGFYELHLSRTIVSMGKKGGVLVDVGANYGYFSCLWASQNPRNKVFAFEASPPNIGPLTNNVSKNSLGERINVIPIAMGREKGKLKFDMVTDEKQTSWGGFTISDEPNSVEVEVDTLDNYAADHNINSIDVLKIDTEGADTWVLYGAERLLKEKRIKKIFFEHNATRMKLLKIGMKEAQEFLEGMGYTVEQHSTTDFYAYPEKVKGA